MRIQRERTGLINQRMLKTDIARELYEKFYSLLFEFAKDLKNSNVREIRITDDSVVITTKNEGIVLNCPEGEMTSALGQLILAGAERDEQEMMKALLTRVIENKDAAARPVFFDIGANIGWYSIYFAQLFANLEIHAFEPVVRTYEQLLKNAALNAVRPVQANKFGLADRNGQADFYVSPSLLAASSLADTVQVSDKTKITGEIRRLDDYCSGSGAWPDFIKCDVEGAELLVFAGAERVLAEARPVVMTELLRKWSKCFGYHPNEVLDLFRSRNYSCFVMAGGGLRPFGTVTEETIESNYFFLHNEAHRGLDKCRRS